MDYRRKFMIENPYSYKSQKYIFDANDSRAIKKWKDYVQGIKAELPAYFVVTMRTNTVSYDHKPNGMSWEDYNTKIKPLKPKTEYINMTFFRIKDYIPMGKTGGIFTAPKIVIPNPKLETLDGRQIDGFVPYEIEYGTAAVLSDAVLAEVSKNFVHPKLNLNNFGKYSPEDVESYQPKYYYFEHNIYTKQQAAVMYGRWKEGRQSLKEHFDRVFEREAQERRQASADAQRTAAQQNRYESQFEKDFGGW